MRNGVMVIIRARVLVSSYGQPMFWLEPNFEQLEPKRSAHAGWLKRFLERSKGLGALLALFGLTEAGEVLFDSSVRSWSDFGDGLKTAVSDGEKRGTGAVVVTCLVGGDKRPLAVIAVRQGGLLDGTN